MTLVVGVTGTDTGVGKTVVTAALALSLRQRGVRLDAVKVVATGVDGDGFGEDAETLGAATGKRADECVLETFSAPRSPLSAAALEGRRIDVAALVERLRERALQSDADVLLLEGVGGIRVPLDASHTIQDVFRAMDARMVVVARAGLGTINHTLLTLDACASAGLHVIATLLVDTDGVDPAFARDNMETIAACAGVPDLLVETVGHVADGGDQLAVAQAIGGAAIEQLSDRLGRLAAEEREARAHAVAADRAHVWHPFTQTSEWVEEEPIVVSSGEGSWLVDVNGRRYLDAIASLWANVHGHAHPVLDRALHEQVGRVAHSTFLGQTHEAGSLLAEDLCAQTSPGLERVFFSEAGAAALEAALRMALLAQRYRGEASRTRFMSLEDAYHGDTAGAVSVGYSDPFHRGLEPLLFDTVRVPPPQLVGEEESLIQLRAALDAHGPQLAAFLIEPRMQGAAGMWAHSDSWLRQAADHARRAGALVICDEVATGFGRTGSLFASAGAGVTPDILVLGKGLSGGYLPLSATVTSEEIFDLFTAPYAEHRTFYYGHTYSANPLACAVARASLALFESEQTLKRAAVLAARLQRGLAELANTPGVWQVRQRGTMAGIELRAPDGTPLPAAARTGRRVVLEARRRGVIVRPLGDVVVLNPPLTMSENEADFLLDAVASSVDAIGLVD